jgi:glycosyltransferase involved in cell wall biosynthesis
VSYWLRITAALRQTLDTLVCQTLADFELIICDDASPDSTSVVVAAYSRLDSRLTYHRNPHNLGMPGNLNVGIRLSRGQFIANVHDGDLYHSTLLEKWTTALERNPTAAFVFNQYRILASDGTTRTIEKEPLAPIFSGKYLLEEIFFRRRLFGSPVWGTVMARRTAYLEGRLFDERFGFLSDVDMWMRLAEKHDVAYVPETLISLPSCEKLPRQFYLSPYDRRLTRMFLEARMPHYKGRPFRRCIEAGRHLTYTAFLRTYYSLAQAKNEVRGLFGQC